MGPCVAVGFLRGAPTLAGEDVGGIKLRPMVLRGGRLVPAVVLLGLTEHAGQRLDRTFARGRQAGAPYVAGIGTGIEFPALQTNLPTVRFLTLTRTEFCPAGRLFGSWPESDQLPTEPDDFPSSVASTDPFASRT